MKDARGWVLLLGLSAVVACAEDDAPVIPKKGKGGSAGESAAAGAAGSEASDACGGSGATGEVATFEAIPAAFDKYCRGTLLKAATLSPQPGPLKWTQSSGAVAPIGTTFLHGVAIFTHRGYVFSAGGKPAELSVDGSPDLVLGEAFTSTCTEPPNKASLLIAEGLLYATKELTGEPCRLPALSTFAGSLTVSGGGCPPDVVVADATVSLCGFEKSYTPYFPLVTLYSQ